MGFLGNLSGFFDEASGFNFHENLQYLFAIFMEKISSFDLKRFFRPFRFWPT
jgi:hypothetical protein